MWKWIVLILFLILIAIAVWWMLRRPSSGTARTTAGQQGGVPAEPDAAGTGDPYDQALDAPTPYDGADQPVAPGAVDEGPIGGGAADYGQRYSDGSTDVTSSGGSDLRAESLPADAPPGREDRTGQTQATASYDLGDTTSEAVGRGHGEPAETWQGTDAARQTEQDTPGSAGMGTSSSGGNSVYRDSVTGTQNQADLGHAGSGQVSYIAPGQQPDADTDETSGSGTGLGRHTGEGSFSGVQSDAYNAGTIDEPEDRDLAGGAGSGSAGSHGTGSLSTGSQGTGSHSTGSLSGGEGGAIVGSDVTADEVAGPYGPGSAEPGPDGSGPYGWAVKGNRGSMLFHTQDSPSYQDSTAEVWFESEDAARAAGFKHWDRKRR